jgi:ABC-type nitrate/sulfonate/bicarbonate transport system substrate-binding protein
MARCLSRTLVMLGVIVLAACAPAAQRPATTGGATTQAPSGTPASLTALKSAYSALSVSQLSVMVAKDLGLFEKHGLDVDLLYIAGLAKIAEALIANEIDVGITPAPTAIGAGIEGADLVMIACWSDKSSFSGPERCTSKAG